jgi:threonine synthase
VDIFIMHPHGRVSEVQRRQMTTVIGPNIHNIAIDGDFDDCQELVKASFADQSFLPPGLRLVAVNSINWARIMAQIVYYVAAALALRADGQLRRYLRGLPRAAHGSSGGATRDCHQRQRHPPPLPAG